MNTSLNTLASVLKTTLYLLERNASIDKDGEAFCEYKRALHKLLVELQAEMENPEPTERIGTHY